MLRKDFDGGRALGLGEVRLQGLMWEIGSISAADRAMGLSCHRAWLLMDALNRMSHQAVAIAGAATALAAGCGGAARAALRQKLRALVDEMAPPDGWGPPCHESSQPRPATGR